MRLLCSRVSRSLSGRIARGTIHSSWVFSRVVTGNYCFRALTVAHSPTSIVEPESGSAEKRQQKVAHSPIWTSEPESGSVEQSQPKDEKVAAPVETDHDPQSGPVEQSQQAVAHSSVSIAQPESRSAEQSQPEHKKVAAPLKADHDPLLRAAKIIELHRHIKQQIVDYMAEYKALEKQIRQLRASTLARVIDALVAGADIATSVRVATTVRRDRRKKQITSDLERPADQALLRQLVDRLTALRTLRNWKAVLEADYPTLKNAALSTLDAANSASAAVIPGQSNTNDAKDITSSEHAQYNENADVAEEVVLEDKGPRFAWGLLDDGTVVVTEARDALKPHEAFMAAVHAFWQNVRMDDALRSDVGPEKQENAVALIILHFTDEATELRVWSDIRRKTIRELASYRAPVVEGKDIRSQLLDAELAGREEMSSGAFRGGDKGRLRATVKAGLYLGRYADQKLLLDQFDHDVIMESFSTKQLKVEAW